MAADKVNFKSVLHEEAVKYAQRGIPVFPIVRNRDMVVVKWRDVATTDLNQINVWWTDGPDKNIGILTGQRSGILVAHFPTSEALSLAQEKGLPVAPMATTNTGHYIFFRYKEEYKDAVVNDEYPGVVFIGDDKYVIAPPSVLSLNPGAAFDKPTTFSWVDGKGLGDIDLGDVPGWLLSGAQETTSILRPIAEVTMNFDEVFDEQPVIMEIREERQANDKSEVSDTDTEPTPPEEEASMHLDPISEGERQGGPALLQFEDWKAPVLFEGAEVEHIKAELLPSWLGEYAGAISKSKQTPEGLAVMLGLSIVAACVQKKFIVAPYGDDDYTEQLSLWTVTVLKSGERKSAVLNPMRAPLIGWEKEQAELLKSQIQDTATAINVAQRRIDKLQKDAGNEAEAVQRQSLVDQISEIKASMPVQVKAPVLWTADVTPEALQDMLAEHDEKMALLSDEGNIFEIMAGLYNEGRINIDIFLQAYSGSPTKIMRKTRKVDLDKPALTFGLAVQPVVIEHFAKSSKKEFKGKGALGRFLFCLPESMLGKRTTGDRTIVPAGVFDSNPVVSLAFTLGATIIPSTWLGSYTDNYKKYSNLICLNQVVGSNMTKIDRITDQIGQLNKKVTRFREIGLKRYDDYIAVVEYNGDYAKVITETKKRLTNPIEEQTNKYFSENINPQLPQGQPLSTKHIAIKHQIENAKATMLEYEGVLKDMGEFFDEFEETAGNGFSIGKDCHENESVLRLKEAMKQLAATVSRAHKSFLTGYQNTILDKSKEILYSHI